MNSVYSFTVIMLIWVISDYISKKTNSFLSSLFVASFIFLVGFKSNNFVVELARGSFWEPVANTFSKDLLPSSSLLAFGTTIVGFVIVHLGTMISLEELKKQYKTFLIGIGAVLGITTVLFLIGPHLKGINYVIAGIAALTGATVSIVIVQQQAMSLGLISVAAFPVLIAALQGLVGFPLTTILLKKEAKRLQTEYRNGNLVCENKNETITNTKRFKVLSLNNSTSGTLFLTGTVVLVSQQLSLRLTNGFLHPFVIALILGVILREVGLFKANMLSGIDAFGVMMLGVLIIVFGPLASITPNQLIELIWPITVTFVVGLIGNIIFSAVLGKFLKYSIPMSIAIGLTCLFGFPGTMILSQEASKSVGETEEEIAAIEANILPKMIIAGFSTVTITSVIITGIIVKLIV